MSSRTYLVSLYVLAAACSGDAAGREATPPALAVDTLVEPAAEFPEPFDRVAAIRELVDGRLLVADVAGRSVSLAGFDDGELSPVGREGSGPREYGFPRNLLPLPGDTTWIVDPIQRRFLVVGPDGRPVSTIPFPEDAGLGDFRGTDEQGRVYYQASPFRLGDAPPETMPDSAPVVRWDRAARFDTVAMAKLPATSTQTSDGGGARIMMRRAQPFAAADAWTVARDGRVAVARVADYRIEWYGGDAPVRGLAIQHEPVAVSQADRDEVIEAMSSGRGTIRVTIGGGRSVPAPPPPSEDDIDFPEYKPPFVANQVFAAGDGSVWVQRSGPAAAAPQYDVFDGRGELVRRVVLPADARVVGFGRGAVYVSRTDDDGLQWLGRYAR